jgi:hypothetical protein
MLIFRKVRIYVIIICFQIFSSSNAALSEGFLNKHDLHTVQTVCEINDYQIGFCSDKNLDGDTVILRLHSIKSLVLNNQTHAFRVFATIENLSKRIISNSKLRIMFGEDESEHLTFIIPQKVIYKDTSSSKISHLIRSDVKSVSKLYEKINFIYFNADPSSIKLRPIEINFVKN